MMPINNIIFNSVTRCAVSVSLSSVVASTRSLFTAQSPRPSFFVFTSSTPTTKTNVTPVLGASRMTVTDKRIVNQEEADKVRIYFKEIKSSCYILC